jgi:hypothetical protein
MRTIGIPVNVADDILAKQANRWLCGSANIDIISGKVL